MPGDDEYGDDADNEFFNPDGRFGKLGLPEFEQSYINAATTKKNTKPIFNLRRYTQKDGKIRDVLYMIIPNYNVGAGRHKEADPKLEIANDNSTIIRDTGLLQGILILDEERIYAFFPFFWRAKYPGDEKWQIY